MQANEMRLGGRRELVVVFSLVFLFWGVWGCPFLIFLFLFFFWEKGDSSFSKFLNYSNPELIISSSILFFIQDPLNR